MADRSLNKINRSPLRWLFLILAVSPAILPLALICKFGYNMHVQDEWDPHVGGLNILLHDHALTFYDLFRQHNEHRILLPRLVFLALASISHWNEMWELFAEWLAVLATSIGIFWLIVFAFRRPADPSRANESISTHAIVLWFIGNLLIFTPAAWENWMWGMGLANVMPMLFITATFVVVCSNARGALKLSVAILFALAATYSSGNGLLVWPLAGLLLAWPWNWREWLRRKWILIGWFLAGCVIVGTYFIGYVKPDHRGAHPQAKDLADALNYLPVFLGTPFAFIGHFVPVDCARIAGLVEIALFLAAVVYVIVRCINSGTDEDDNARIVCGKLLLGLMLASFGFCSGFLASMNRAGFGVQQAVQSARYVSFALYLPLGIILIAGVIVAEMRARSKSRRPVHRVIPHIAETIGALVCLLIAMTWPEAINNFRITRIYRLEAKAALLLYKVMPNNPAIAIIFPDPSVVVNQSPRFEELGFIAPAPLTSLDARNIEVTDPREMKDVSGAMERVELASPSEIHVIGWAAFMANSAPADTVLLSYETSNSDPKFFAMAQLGMPRPDLAMVSSSSIPRLSGWQLYFPRNMLPDEGRGWTIAAWAFDVDSGKAFRLDGAVRLPLSP